MIYLRLAGGGGEPVELGAPVGGALVSVVLAVDDDAVLGRSRTTARVPDGRTCRDKRPTSKQGGGGAAKLGENVNSYTTRGGVG